MKRLLLLLCLLLAVAPASAADLNLTLMGVSGGGATYVGPIDIVASPTAWYGLRAGSGAIAAAGTQKLVNVRRASDNVACDFLVASSGGFGVTTATCNSSTQGGVSFGTFVGSDGTASCTLALTTGTCSGATGTVHVNDVVTGTGLTQPCIVASASNTAPTIEIAGTTTSCGTVGVAETFTFQVAGFVTKLYDQSGNSKDAAQATAGNQPQQLPLAAGGGTLPTLSFVSASAQWLGPFTTSGSGARTVSTVAQRNGNFTSLGIIGGLNTNTAVCLRYFNSTNTVDLSGSGSDFTATVSDGAFHAIQGIINGNSPASFLLVDATTTTGTAATGGAGSGGIGASGNGGEQMQGFISELGWWSAAFSGTQAANMHTNQSTYWSTP